MSEDDSNIEDCAMVTSASRLKAPLFAVSIMIYGTNMAFLY